MTDGVEYKPSSEMNVRLLYVYIFAEHIHEKQTSQCEKKRDERKKKSQPNGISRPKCSFFTSETDYAETVLARSNSASTDYAL